MNNQGVILFQSGMQNDKLTETKKRNSFIKIIHGHDGIFERFVFICFYATIYSVLLNLRIRKLPIQALSKDQSVSVLVFPLLQCLDRCARYHYLLLIVKIGDENCLYTHTHICKIT